MRACTVWQRKGGAVHVSIGMVISTVVAAAWRGGVTAVRHSRWSMDGGRVQFSGVRSDLKTIMKKSSKY